MHKLLDNQIKKHFGELDSLPGNVQSFLTVICRAYREFEEDYSRLELAQDIIVRELEVQSRQKELLLQSAGDGILGVDLKGRVIFFNPAAEKMLGYLPQELLGLSFREIIDTPQEDEKDDSCSLINALNHRASYRQTHATFRKNGRASFPVDYTCSPILDQGESKGVVIVFKNISEQIHTQQTLKRYARELEESKSNMEDFVAIASHDLKEPLRKISSFGGILSNKLESRLAGKEKEYLTRIISASKRMDQLITHLLEFSKVGIQSLELRELDFKKLLRDAIHLLEVPIHQTQGTVKISVDPNLPPPVIYADLNQIHQLFQNLISNALKYRRKEVPPDIRILIRPLDRDFIKVTVQDNGIGFDESHAQRIFKPFERLHGKSDYEGSGMGLSICQKIVTRHGGAIEVTSQPNKGSTFALTLPVREISSNGTSS